MAEAAGVTAGAVAEAKASPGAKPSAAPAPGPGIGDLWGGLASMLVAFPSSIAFGVVIFTAASPELASAGALAGIVGAAALGIVAPLVGRNGGFITAPCAPAAAVMSGLAAALAAQGDLAVERILALLALTALLSAVLQVVYGAVRAGRIIKYIPYQVVTGYLSGVAVIIAVAQLPKLLGVPRGEPLASALVSPGLWAWPGVVVGLVTVVTMALAPRLTKKVPGAIVGLAAGVAAYFALGLLRPEMLRLAGNRLVVGPISVSWGSLLDGISGRASSLLAVGAGDVFLVMGTALTLSVLLSIDTLKTGVVLDALTRRRHDSNRELVAQGVANAASFFAGGVPGAGTMGATLVNVTSGGRTPRSGVIEGVLVLATLLALGSLVAWIPIAALAGILLVIAWRMFDFGMFRLLLLPSTRLDFLVIAAVVVVAQAAGLIEAAVVGVLLAVLLFLRNQMRASVVLRKVDLRDVRSKRRRAPEAMRVLDEHGAQAALVQMKDDLFFGTTDQLFTELERDLAERTYILLDFRRVQSMDYTAAQLFHQMHVRLRDRGGQLLFSGMPSSLSARQNIEHYLGQLGLVGVGGIPVYETRDSALEWMEDRVLESAGWSTDASKPPLALEELGMFRHLEPELVRELAALAREASHPAGTRIFGAGDPGDEICFVRKGRVHVLLPLEGGKRHHLATFARGEFFGEMAFLDRGVRSADAEAATDTELFTISRTSFDVLARTNDPLAARIFEGLALGIAQRLRVTDGELRALEER